MNAAPYEALVVDFGGVLTTPLQDSMQAFADDHGIEISDLVRAALGAYSGMEDNLVVDFETGRVGDEEFTRSFAARLTDSTGVEIAHDGLLRRLFGTLQLEEDMMDVVGRARAAGYRTGLLSNSWGVGYYPRERLAEIFDVVVISGEVGLRKPDPEIFTLTVDRLGVSAPGCVFVDDHPGHLKAAQEAGMTTVLHRTPQETITELHSLLALPQP